MNLPSKMLQSEKIDLLAAHDQLRKSLLSIEKLRNQFDSLLTDVSEICDKWKIEKTFLKKRMRKVKIHFDKLSQDERFDDPEQPNSPKSELKIEADKFSKTFPVDVSSSFSAQLFSVRSTFSDEMKDVKELAYFLIIQNASLSSSYPDVCTDLLMFLTVPVTTTKDERSFSKLKLIKNYLRSTMQQERLSSLSLSSIENQRARVIDSDKVIDQFVSVKNRQKIF
ncbi:uncharacterized protein LOC126895659 [Daktulosphaira vitifoliae]|uniref:uncharacterized protein LOC126895659 n=1 Tax=Daktulosphaira vitifoliae TaxID=58002 RepID=UPI0021A97C4E|nr:uncharacterized protein LOC126895659 [Daktulosphaira vitifoliae]